MLIIFEFRCEEHGVFEELFDNRIPGEERVVDCPQCGKAARWKMSVPADVTQHDEKEWKAFRKIASLQQAQKDRDAARPYKHGRPKDPITVGSTTQKGRLQRKNNK